MAAIETQNVPQQVVAVSQQPQQSSISLRDLWAISLAHKWWYLISLFVCLLLASLYLLRTPKQYTRTASVMIKEDKGTRNLSEFGDFADLSFNTVSTVDNELISMQSPSTLLEVVKRLHLDYSYQIDGFFKPTFLYGRTLPIEIEIQGLDDNQDASLTLTLNGNDVVLSKFRTVVNEEKIKSNDPIKTKVGETVKTPIGEISIKSTPYFGQNDNLEISVSRSSIYNRLNTLQKSISAVINNKKASVIDLTISDVNIQRAEEIINTLVNVYNELWVKDKNQIAVSTSEFINERLKVIESELGHVDSNISNFKSSNLIPDVEQASTMAMQQTATSESQVRQLNNEMYMARYVRSNILRDDKTFQLLPVNCGINNNTIEKQISEYNTLVLQRNSLVSNSSEQNPLVVDTDQKLKNLRATIVSSIDNHIASLQEQISSERGNIQANIGRMERNPQQAKELLSVERQQKVKESLYLFLLQKREENELSQAFSAYNTRIITPPMGSMQPTSPKSKQILAIALLLGLAIPFGIIYLLETMNTRVRGRKDLEKLTAPFIGEIPLYRPHHKAKEGGPEYRILVKARSRSIMNEAFRVVRTNIEFMTNSLEKPAKVFNVTSANAGSGKTFLIGNIAASFGVKDKKVIGIDLDLRRSSFSEFVNKPTKGITDYLTGQVDECPKYQVADNPNFEIIPVGTAPPNPTELISVPKLQKLIEQLRQEYDYVFIDCPPVDIVADTTIISQWTDMTLFVVRAGLMEREMLPRIDNFYKEKKFNNMGILLNGTLSEHGSYGYGYGYGYGHYGSYGYGYGSKKHHKHDYYTKDEDEA